MSRRLRHAALLVILLVLPAEAFCAVCATGDCAQATATFAAPSDCGEMMTGEMMAEHPAGHGTAMAPTEHPSAHHGVDGSPTSADDCCSAGADLDAGPAATAPAADLSFGLVPAAAQPVAGHNPVARRLDSARGLPPPPRLAPLYTLHSSLLI